MKITRRKILSGPEENRTGNIRSNLYLSVELGMNVVNRLPATIPRFPLVYSSSSELFLVLIKPNINKKAQCR